MCVVSNWICVLYLIGYVFFYHLFRFINARRRILQPMLDSNTSYASLNRAKKIKPQKVPAQRAWPESIGVYSPYHSADGLQYHTTTGISVTFYLFVYCFFYLFIASFFVIVCQWLIFITYLEFLIFTITMDVILRGIHMVNTLQVMY